MSFLADQCTFEVLTEKILAESNPFTCGDDPDMDDFFRKDALTYARRRLGKTYCFRLEADKRCIVACFTLSNDSIRIWDLGSSKKNAMWKEITNREKMLSRFPGVLIGRLAVAKEYIGKGIGSEILDFIKFWFLSEENKTGCRLAIVDAKNEAHVLKFYEKNGFKFLFRREIDEDLYTMPAKTEEEQHERLNHPRKLNTRLMYCDLID
ncbi:MAG: GNAT family N-acetyltransferase [Bacteroidales bacterium]|nr:GNAT family N-acetyltransferase [Bacteroidales bacterium]